MIDFECPACESVAQAPRNMAGQRMTCRTCGVLLEIPTLAEAGLGPEPQHFETIGGPVEEPSGRRVVCERCGNFMEAPAKDGEAAVCGPCQGKSAGGFPFDRRSFDFGKVLGYAFETFQKDWLTYSLASFILGVVPMILAFGMIFVTEAIKQNNRTLGEVLGIASNFVQQPIQLLLSVGLAYLCQQGLMGRRPEVGMIFHPLSRLITIILSFFCMTLMFALLAAVCGGVGFGVYAATGEEGLGVLAGIALGLPVMIYAGLPIIVCWSNELAYNPDVGAIEAISNSYTIASGYRWWLLLLVFLGGMISQLGVLACCIGVFVTQAIMYLIFTTTFMTLRAGSGLPPARRA